MIFKEVFGQEQAIDLLKHDLQSQNVTHAYLFSGSLGIGKTKTALQFAKAIACPKGGCLKCEVCTSFEKKLHPDFQLLRATGNHIVIDQIRQLEYWVALKSGQSLRKVVIIEEVERLTKEAANALLKTLEEPQESVVFINITSNENAVLPTIFSRCRCVRFKPIPYEKLILYLTKQGYDPEKVELSAKLSQGVFGKAVNLAANQQVLELRKEVLNCMKNVLDTGEEKVSLLAESFLQVVKDFQQKDLGDEVLNQALDFWWLWVRDLVVYKETGDKSILVDIDCFDEIAKTCENDKVYRSWYLMQKIPKIKEMIKQNINPQLALETMLLEATSA